jgi:integrase
MMLATLYMSRLTRTWRNGRRNEGQRRSAYSLRHTYICLRLMEGADIYQIAKNCRTSVEMIETYYASHIKTRLDAAAINIRRPRSPKKRVQAARSKHIRRSRSPKKRVEEARSKELED